MGGKRILIGGAALIIGMVWLAPAFAATFPRDTPAEKFCAAIESELVATRFDALDALESELRDPDTRLVGGNSQLYEFYGALGAYATSGLFSCGSHVAFDEKRQLLERWVAAKPASVGAHIALAQLWWNSGVTQRGADYANSVGFFQWIGLYSALSKAKAILAQLDTRADPHAYYLLTAIAQFDWWWFSNPRETLDGLYADAVKAYPMYYHLYSQRADNLQVRWHGQPGELRAYLNSLATSPGGDAGSVAYSYIAYKLMQGTDRSALLNATGLSWPLIQSGYAARERLYGMRNRDWNALFNLALAGIDRDAAKAALVHIGDHWDPVIWNERRYFDYAVQWTNKVDGAHQ